MGDVRAEGTADSCMRSSSCPGGDSDAEVVSFGNDAADNGGMDLQVQIALLGCIPYTVDEACASELHQDESMVQGSPFKLEAWVMMIHWRDQRQR